MGKFDGALILSDIDGTYLGSNRCPGKGNVEAIRYFQSEGGLFTFATGRMVVNTMFAVPNIEELANFPVVLNNGTSLYDYRTQTRSYSSFMEPEIVKALMEYVTEYFPHIGIRVSVPEGFVYPYEHPMILRDMSRVRHVARMLPFEAWDITQIYKVVFRGTSEELAVMQAALNERFADLLTIVLSEVEILETQKKGVSKGSMINMLRRQFAEKGEPMRIFCIGDYENDLEMLRAADFAACPSNAIDSVKEIAQIHLCSCDDGAVADLISYIESHPELLRS